MNPLRVLYYGIILWVVAILVSILETELLSGVIITVLFYFLMVIFYGVTMWIYFARTKTYYNWLTGVEVATILVFIDLFLNILVLVVIFSVPLSWFLNYHQLIGYSMVIGLGAFIAYWLDRKKVEQMM